MPSNRVARALRRLSAGVCSHPLGNHCQYLGAPGKCRSAHHRAFVAAVVALAVLMCTVVGAAVWLVVGVVSDLPDSDTLQGIGSMSRATTVLDASDAPAFTIFKEQRLEVPLSRVSPHLIAAILAVEISVFTIMAGSSDPRGRRGVEQRARRLGLAGRQHDYPQLARQSFLTPRTRPCAASSPRSSLRCDREGVSKKQNPRALPPKVYRDGLYGVEAASLGYFGSMSADLMSRKRRSSPARQGAVNQLASSARARACAAERGALQVMRDAGVIDAATFRQRQPATCA